MVKVWGSDTTSDETYTEAKLLDRSLAARISPYISKCQSLLDTEIVSTISIEITSDFPPNDFFVCFRLHIVSEGIKQLIEASKVTQVEFFPVRVFVDGKEYVEKRYFFMHVLGKVVCFDKQASEYKTRPAADGVTMLIRLIRKLCLLPVDTSTHKLFRVAEVSSFILCIDDGIAQQIMDAGFTGMRFLDPSETYW
jgi:hypothetical protein